MNKYYATITLKVLVRAADEDEASVAFDDIADLVAETVEDVPSEVELIDAGFKITDVK